MSYLSTCTNYVLILISQMAKNKGLTPKRKKIDRNPRVKHKEKFRRAKIRRKGQVCIPHADENLLTCISFSRFLDGSPEFMATLRPFFIFTRSVRFVRRRRDTAERCPVFVLVSRRASNLSNQERIQHKMPSGTTGLKQARLIMDGTCCLLWVTRVVKYITDDWNVIHCCRKDTKMYFPANKHFTNFHRHVYRPCTETAFESLEAHF